MKVKFKYRLNIAGYCDNAAEKFSYLKLSLFTLFSLGLSALLINEIIKNNYQGKALLFSSIALLLIVGYFILNVIALFKKITKKS